MNKKVVISPVILLVAIIIVSIFILSIHLTPKRHNVAIKSIIPSTEQAYLGSIIDVNVTVENEGDFPETFDLTLRCNDTIIKTLDNIELAPKMSKNLTITWNTTNFSVGLYYLQAEISQLLEEENLTDNTLTYGPIEIVHEPVLSLSLSKGSIYVGEEFTVAVTIEGKVYNLYGIEFKLSWNTKVIDFINVSEGDFLRQGGETFFYKSVNETSGIAHITSALIGEVPGVSGNGTLAIFLFRSKAYGESTLHLYDTILGDSDIKPIPHAVRDAYIKVCAVISVYPAAQKVSLNEEFAINVTVEHITNLCGYEFRLSFDNTAIKAINVSIPEIFGEATQILKNEINNSIGRIWIVVVSLPLTPLDGDYVLCQIQFHAIDKGNVSLTLYQVKLGDEEANPIPVIVHSGFVEIDPPIGESKVRITQTDSTIIFVDPPEISAKVGQQFTIRINISEVTDLYGWEFKLSWDPNLLEVTNVIEGDFLRQGGETFFYKNINNTAGWLHLTCTLLGDIPGVSGNGTLAEITFYVKSSGESALDLYDTELGNSNIQSIPHVVKDGYGLFIEETKNFGGANSSLPVRDK